MKGHKEMARKAFDPVHHCFFPGPGQSSFLAVSMQKAGTAIRTVPAMRGLFVGLGESFAADHDNCDPCNESCNGNVLGSRKTIHDPADHIPAEEFDDKTAKGISNQIGCPNFPIEFLLFGKPFQKEIQAKVIG